MTLKPDYTTQDQYTIGRSWHLGRERLWGWYYKATGRVEWHVTSLLDRGEDATNTHPVTTEQALEILTALQRLQDAVEACTPALRAKRQADTWSDDHD